MASTPDCILEIRDLRTHFFTDKGVVRAVDGVTLDLKRKSTLGIVGESGCGKSVTASSVMRLLKEPPGKIVDGEIRFYPSHGSSDMVDLAQIDPRGPLIREIRGGEISMIFQEPMTSLNPLFTIGRQIAESVMLHQHLDENDASARALEMLNLVHMSDPEQRLKQYPHQLSGGMRQRVMIALALSCNPAILIAFLTWAVVAWLVAWLPFVGPLVAMASFSLVLVSQLLCAALWLTGLLRILRCDDSALPLIGRVVARLPD